MCCAPPHPQVPLERGVQSPSSPPPGWGEALDEANKRLDLTCGLCLGGGWGGGGAILGGNHSVRGGVGGPQ